MEIKLDKPKGVLLQYPDKFKPSVGVTEFPQITVEDLKQLKEQGWSRVGIVAIIMDSYGNILISENPPDDDKVPRRQYGFSSETSHIYGDTIESPLETLARCISEELDIDDPSEINAHIPATNPYIIVQWPVGGKHENEFALAICPVVIVDDDSAKLLTKIPDYSSPLKKNEVTAADFIEPYRIPRLDCRDGIDETLRQIRSSGLLDPGIPLKSVSLTLPQYNEPGKDIIL